MKVPQVFVTDNKKKLENLLKETKKKKESLVGREVYVPMDYQYPDRSSLISLSKISRVKKTKIIGKQKTYVKIERNPKVWHDWDDYLEKHQAEWEEEYNSYNDWERGVPEFNC